ncbi:MAG: S46 family peptidase [Clostridium sp.]|nr:S46 family peptidase [Clostridium sp.]
MKRKITAWLLLLTCCFGARADEGMWMMNNINPKTMEIMKQLGLKLTEQEMYNPEGTSLKDAVVIFGGFCTGVVVSPDGLVFTNHHCGFSAIQALATPQNDILQNGYVAHSQEEELPAEDLFVMFLDRTENVTDRVNAALNDIWNSHPEAAKTYGKNWKRKLKEQSMDSIYNSIRQEYVERDSTKDVMLQSYYTGNEYYVNVYTTFKDIRLVFAPPQSLGKYGGETDNWMWPRQTADFSVFRIYADSLNQPAPYAVDNRPYKSKRYAPVSLDGYEKGDYCMTVGFPGSTNRYLSSFGIKERMACGNEARINVRGVKQEVWNRWMDSDPTIRLQYAAKYAQSSNYWKNSIGMNRSLEKLGVIKEKQELEKKLAQWWKKDADTKQRFGSVLKDLKKAYAKRAEIYRALNFLSETNNGIEIFEMSRLLTAIQEEQDSTERTEMITELQTAYKDYNPQVDKETTTALLRNLADVVPTKYLPEFYKEIKKEYKNNYEAYVNDMFNDFPYTDSTYFAKNGVGADIKGRKATLAADNMSHLMRRYSMQIRPYSDERNYGEQLLCQALLEMEQDEPHYSDANFSMRLSYGFVNDYTSEGTHHNYYTTVESLLDKVAQADKVKEYAMQPEVARVFHTTDFSPYADRKTGKMQLCFLTNNDITGGNSGSPMFNGKGEVIGLAFDGNWDAMSSDISFTQDLTRCIGVDIRYVLFLMDRWGGADRLLHELGVK